MSDFIKAVPSASLPREQDNSLLNPVHLNDGFSSLAKESRGQWSPYNVNEGTCVGIAGKDFVVMASDTRMSDGYSIISRNVSKMKQITSQCILLSAGMQADANSLQRILDLRSEQFLTAHHKEMPTEAFAQLLSNTLYYKRFFPYYAFNVVGGLDKEGKGVIYGYDAVGSFEVMRYCVTGSGTYLITPVLDNIIGQKVQNFIKDGNEDIPIHTTRDINKTPNPLSLEDTIKVMKDCFSSAAERDIYTGDMIEIAVITKEGIKYEYFQLKKD